jgi:hypothetical protein
MRVRMLSPTGDMTFGNGLQNFWNNVPQAVGQVVQTSMLLWLGEWYLDTTAGMPWIQGVLGKHNQDTADATVQDYISNIQGVTDIESFESVDTQSDRSYAAETTIDTLYGQTSVQVTNGTLY